MSLQHVTTFALLAVANAKPAAPAKKEKNLDARLHELSTKIGKLELPECNEDYGQCKDFCHSNGISWESKCDTDYHCCSKCPRCTETANLLPSSFMLESASTSGYCLHAEEDFANFVSIIWSSGCGHAALKMAGLDAGDGNFVLHITSDNDVYGDSTFCIHPHDADGTGDISNNMELVMYDDCSLNRANMQFSPIWDGDTFMLQSVDDTTFCVHTIDNDSVGDDVKLVFKKGCGDSAAKFSALEAP
jgi:hypothetical protein